jgi:hypothetical protein
MEESCCTCATLLKNILLQYDEKSEKPKALDRRLDCCGRIICGNCIADNPRFKTYCMKPCFPRHLPQLIVTQVPFVKSLRLQLRCPRASEIHHHTLHHLLRNRRLHPKIRQHTPKTSPRTPPSRIRKLRHWKKVRVHSPKTYYTS